MIRLYKKAGKEGADMDEKQLRELQLKSLETLKEFIKFCDDNFLTYYLIGGCLIGAVRSGGFLPWDDDIDVFMPRSDYERLWQMWDSSGRFKLLRTTENVYTRSQFMTLCDTETTCVREFTKDLPIPQGITMDIIPLDGCPLSRIKRRRQKRHAILYSLYILDMLPQNHGKLSRIAASIFLKKSREKKIKLWKKYQAKMCAYRVKQSVYLTELCSGIKYMSNEYPIEWFGSTVKLNFEGIQVSVPIGYKEYLSMVFGDYMTPPPESEQHPAHGILFVDTEKPYTEALKEFKTE